MLQNQHPYPPHLVGHRAPLHFHNIPPVGAHYNERYNFYNVNQRNTGLIPMTLYMTVRNGLRDLVRSHGVNPSVNAKGWSRLSNELNHRGFRRQGFRCSVIANHINDSRMATVDKTMQATRAPRNRHQLPQKAQESTTQDTASKIHRRVSFILHQRSPDATKLQEEGTEKKTKKIVAKAESSPTVKTLAPPNKQHQPSKKAPNQTNRAQKKPESSPNAPPNGKMNESTVPNILDSELLSLEQQLSSVEREMNMVREKWLESMQSTVESYKDSLLFGSNLDKNEPDRPVLSDEKQHALQRRHKQLVEQYHQILNRLKRVKQESISA